MVSNKIMVVDDQQDILDAVTIILERKGFNVIALTSPYKLLEQIDRHNPGVILLDVQMGDYDGMVVCQSIKELKEHDHRSVLLFSANKLYKHDVQKCRCDDFIEKPFNVAYFISRIVHHATKE